MSFQKIKTNSYWVGQKQYSDTQKNVGEITFNKKTGRETKFVGGHFSICNRKKSMIVSFNTTAAEGLGDFFKNLGKSSVIVGKKLAKMS